MTDLREQEMQSQIDALSSTAENWKNTAKNSNFAVAKLLIYS